MQHGIVGYSGKQQGVTCNDSCHLGGITPLVRFEGPGDVMAGTLATLRFVVHSQSTKQKVAGFNVAASDGVLETLPGQGERTEAGEIAHDAPKPNVNEESSWDFAWRAPCQPGSSTLYGAGLSANGNGTNGGDDSARATLDVTVTPDQQRGDANCDCSLSAADVTAAVLLLPAGVPGACSLADANPDGVIGPSDVTAIVAALFEPAAP